MKDIKVLRPFCNGGIARLLISTVIQTKPWLLCIVTLICTSGLLCFFVLYCFIPAWQMRRALQWWSKRQSQQLWLNSEHIRNGLLQEVFSLRRRIELSLMDSPTVSEVESQLWFAHISGLYNSLDHLSTRLSPSYVEDSLPLAIQAFLAQNPLWQDSEAPDCPVDWPQEPPDRARIILSVLQALLEIARQPDPIKTSGHLGLNLKSLNPHHPQGALTVTIIYLDELTAIAVDQSQDLRYLGRSFRYLTQGGYRQQRQGRVIEWQLTWLLDLGSHQP